MMGTINKQEEHFVSEMWEFGLLHNTNPSLPPVDLRLVFMMIMSLPSP